MRLEDALKLEKIIHIMRMEIRESKGHDYAQDEECLLNFQNMAKLCKIFDVDVTTSYGVAFFYILLKLDRTANLIFRRKGTKPKNESVWDTVAIDGPNYFDLLMENLVNEGLVEIPPEIKKRIKEK